MEKTKRYFTQRELEKHINARLIRERRKNRELEALKSMVDTLLDEGRINANSYAEAAKALMAMIAGGAVGNKEDIKRERTDDTDMMRSFGDTNTDAASEKNVGTEAGVSKNEHRMSDTAPDNVKINADFPAVAAEKLMTMKNEDAVGNRKETAVTWEGLGASEDLQISELKKLHKDAPDHVTAEDDIADGDGISSVSEDIRERETQSAQIRHKDGKEENAADIVADPLENESGEREGVSDNERLIGLLREFIGILEEKNFPEKKDNGFYARRDICSTGFSKTGSGEDMRLAQALTPTQREIARRAGLSYREYAGLLREIPENTRKRKLMR